MEAAAGDDRPGRVVVLSELELWGHEDLPGMLLADPAELRAGLRDFYGDEAGDEYDRVTLTPPDHLVADREVLDLGDRGVELVHLGRGHTGNDLVVVVPTRAWCSPATCSRNRHLRPTATTASRWSGRPPRRRWSDQDVAMFVPGHGDLMGPAAAAEQVAALATVADLIRELHAAGVPAGDAIDEAAGRWPYPVVRPATAVERGYAALGLIGLIA